MKQTIYLIAVCLMFPAFALAAGAGEPDAAGLQAIQGGSRSVTYKGRVVDERSSVPLAGTSHRNHRKIKEFIFLIINYLNISYFLYFCHILPIFRYSVHF